MHKLNPDLKNRVTNNQNAFKSFEEKLAKVWSERELNEYFERKLDCFQMFLEIEIQEGEGKLQEAKEKETAEKAERDAKEAQQRSEREAKEAQQKAEREAKEASLRAEREAKLAAQKLAQSEDSNFSNSNSSKQEKIAPAAASNTVVQLAAQDKLVGGQRFQLELERADAKRRIVQNPNKSQADITDDNIIDTWIRIRDDEDSLNWMIMGYAEGSDNVLKVVGSGEGGFEEMKASLPDAPVFLYLRYLFGDTGRSKFVFLTYVPDTLTGMKKSKVVQHRPAVTKLIKYFQIEWHLLRRDELAKDALDKKLLAAGGANYSVQEEAKGDFKSYKGTTATFHGIKQ